MPNKIYSKIEELPNSQASDSITEGCIVLEGEAFRGVYTSGVLDCLMMEDINFSCTVGALIGMNYVSGQIGRSARINLRYRHDTSYVSLRKAPKYEGIISFDFVLKNVPNDPF